MFTQNERPRCCYEMAEKNYGAVVVVNEERKVIGVVTERDVMK